MTGNLSESIFSSCVLFYQSPSLLSQFGFTISCSSRHLSSIGLLCSATHFFKSPLLGLSVVWSKVPESLRGEWSSVRFSASPSPAALDTFPLSFCFVLQLISLNLLFPVYQLFGARSPRAYEASDLLLDSVSPKRSLLTVYVLHGWNS